MAIFEVFTLVTPGTVFGPGLDNKVMGLIKHFPVVSRVAIVGNLLAAGTAHPAGDETTAGYHIDRRQLFRQPQWVGNWQGVTHKRNFYFFGNTCQNCRFDIHNSAQREGVGVVFVKHYTIETKLFGIKFFIKISVKQGTGLDRVQKLVGYAEKSGILNDFLFRNVGVRPFSKGCDVHGLSPVSISFPLPARNGIDDSFSVTPPNGFLSLTRTFQSAQFPVDGHNR